MVILTEKPEKTQIINSVQSDLTQTASGHQLQAELSNWVWPDKGMNIAET